MVKDGAAFPITTEWQDGVRVRMRELGLGQHQLAAIIKCKQPSLSALLSPRARHSTLVPAIHAALGWPPPSIPIPSKDLAEIVRLLSDMPPEVKDAWLAQARAIVKNLK